MKRSTAGTGNARKRARGNDATPLLHEEVPYLPESALYSHLVDFEHRLDSVLSRKRLAINEALKKPKPVMRKLRVFLSNTFEPAGTDVTGKPSPACWTLNVEGYVLAPESEDKDKPGAAAAASAGTTRTKMSDVVSRLVIQLDKQAYPHNWLVEWDNSAVDGDACDGFQVVRCGAAPSTVRVLIEVRHDPPRLLASPELAEMLGTNYETRTRFVMALWQYVRRHSLQEPSNRKLIRCNAEMEALFQCETMQFEHMMQAMEPHLSPMPPIELVYQIAVTPEALASCEATYDIEVEVPDPAQHDMTQHALEDSRVKESALNDQLRALAGEIGEHAKRRDFLLVLATNPVTFLQRMLESQVMDAMAKMKPENPDEQRRGEYWRKAWVDDAVTAHLLEVQRTAVEKLKAQEALEAARGVHPMMGQHFD